LREVLDEHEATSRTNFKNDGRGFQREVEMSAEAYKRLGLARLAKIDPPVRMIGGGSHRKVIFLANPWLDFAGVWTAHHGRALFVEVKSHESGRLPIESSGGISTTQMAAICSWRMAGAAVAVLWRRRGYVRLWTPEMIFAKKASGEKSLVFEDGHIVKQGAGTLIWDFLAILELQLWPKNSCE